MNVSLTPHLEEFIHRKVADGLYESESEVVREALRLMALRETVQPPRRSMLEILESLPPPGVFQTSAEVEAYLQEERNSWDR